MNISKNYIALLFSFVMILSACTIEPSASVPVGNTTQHIANTSSGRNNVTVTFIDVGQGDSTLIQTANGVMLIDGGVRAAYDRIYEILHREGIYHIDYLVATHPHADHIGGLVPLIGDNNGIAIGAVIMPDVAHTTRTYENFLEALIAHNIHVIEPYPGQILELDDAVFTIVAPNAVGYSNLNNYSVVMIMDHGNNSFMFTGDAERESELEILYHFEEIFADVLRVGHHGSHTSSTAEFLDAVSPRYAVISAGEGNQFGHPHDVVMRRLADRGIITLITYELGDIVMISDRNNIEIVANQEVR
ncbi:MAG: MBL fold metallo-hydrolase [Defluviitaleaceae bacterium]|nr:MBL fold metallo-hydrolase [Defluviitaleaceae bacterium]